VFYKLEFCLKAVFVALSVWDEDVLNVEHVLTIITVLGAVVAAGRVFIPGNLCFDTLPFG
jgi:autophagy-related protein 9